MMRKHFIKAGWLIDGTGAGAKRDVTVCLNGALISSIEEGAFQTEEGAGVVDLSDCTILPGLVDSHVHLFMSGTADEGIRKRQLNLCFEDAREVISRHLDEHLSCGVVAVRDGGDYGGHSLRYKRECMKQSGPVQVKSPGKAWRAAGRYGRLIGRPVSPGGRLGKAISEETAPIDHIKIVNSGLNSLREFSRQGPPQFSLEELRSAVSEALRLGIGVMVHANGGIPVSLAVESGCTSIEHGFFMGDENIRMLADSGTAWVPTAFTMKAYSEGLDSGTIESRVAWQNLEHQLEQIQKANELGVVMAIGTDSGSLGVHHGSSVIEEMRLFRQAGLSVEQVVKSATSNGALIMGLEKDLGRIAAGIPATFVAVPGGPEGLPEALMRPEGVWINGEKRVSQAIL